MTNESKPGNESQPKPEVTLNGIFATDCQKYITCGWILRGRGFDIGTFTLKVGVAFAMADLTVEGKDAQLVVDVVNFIDGLRNELHLERHITPEENRELSIKVADLLRTQRSSSTTKGASPIRYSRFSNGS